MLRSGQAAEDGNPSSAGGGDNGVNNEFDEIQVESFKKFQFLEYGWKKLDVENGTGTHTHSYIPGKDYPGVSEGDDEYDSSPSPRLQNGVGMGVGLQNGVKISTLSSLQLEKECESPMLEGILSTSRTLENQQIPFSRTHISPYIIDNCTLLNKNTTTSPESNSFGELEPYYYTPQIPPCHCECVISDGIRLEEIPRVSSVKNSHLSLPIPTEGGALRLKKQKQWDSSLDLIVPVSEASNYTTWTPISTSTPTFPSSLDGQTSKRPHNSSSKYGGGMSPCARSRQDNYLFYNNTNHTSLPGTSIISPGTCVGSISQSSPSQSTRAGSTKKKHHFLCIELDFRKICVVCGFLIAAAGVLGVFYAMEMKTLLESNDGKTDLVHKLLSEVPLIDGHNDLAWNLRKFLQNQLNEVNFDTDLTQHEPFSGSAWSHTDLIRLRQGCIGAQLWSAYVPCSAQHLNAVQIAVEQIDVIQRLVNKYPESLRLVTSAKEVEKSHQEKRIASLIGVEGGHAIGNSLAVLRMFYNLGARYLTLTHNCNTPWAGSASPENYLPAREGLSEFGKLVVLEMNRLGMMVDLAHVSQQTMKDGLAVSRAPVIFSHSAASALCNHSRNVPDEILRLVTANGGLVMVSFYNVFIACNETASMQDVIAHIEHIRQVAGVDHVGLGAGFDGINFVPVGLEDVSKYPDLVAALLLKENKWSELDLKKLVGINFLRVFRQVESVRDEWNRVGVRPIEEWIPRDDLEGHRVGCSYQGAR